MQIQTTEQTTYVRTIQSTYQPTKHKQANTQTKNLHTNLAAKSVIKSSTRFPYLVRAPRTGCRCELLREHLPELEGLSVLRLPGQGGVGLHPGKGTWNTDILCIIVFVNNLNIILNHTIIFFNIKDTMMILDVCTLRNHIPQY